MRLSITGFHPPGRSFCRPDGSVRSYRGTIQVVNGTAGENRTVNLVALDDYVRGVVTSESPAYWGGPTGTGPGMNALAAQADLGQCLATPGRCRRPRNRSRRRQNCRLRPLARS